MRKPIPKTIKPSKPSTPVATAPKTPKTKPTTSTGISATTATARRSTANMRPATTASRPELKLKPKPKPAPKPKLKRTRSIRANLPRNPQRNTPSATTPEIAIDRAAASLPLTRHRPSPPPTPVSIQASTNLYNAMGGAEPIAQALNRSSNPKGRQLSELLSDPELLAHHTDDTLFYGALTTVGMSLLELTDTLLEVRQAEMVARMLTNGHEVAATIMSKAVDQMRPHAACLATGRVLDEESGVETSEECFACRGTGYILESAEREWVELYLEMIRMRKSGQQLNIDARRQQLNVFNNGSPSGDVLQPDGAVSIDTIIKRADQQVITLNPNRQLTDGVRVPAMMGMPEDSAGIEAVEAEVVTEAVVETETIAVQETAP